VNFNDMKDRNRPIPDIQTHRALPGKDEPGMKLQHLEKRLWVDYEVDGEVVRSPIKIERLPPDRYRLVE